MDYRLRQQWLCRSDDKGPISFPRTAFVLFENRIVGNVTWIRVWKLRIQSPDPGGMCGVSQWPGNASGRRSPAGRRPTVPGTSHRVLELLRYPAATHSRDDKKRNNGTGRSLLS